MDNIIEKANLDVFSETLLELGKKNKDIIVVTSDSRGSGKLVPFAEQLPESCHNDIESWRKDTLEIYSCIIISSENDFEPIKSRIKFLKEIIHSSGCSIYDVQTQGSNYLGRLFSTIYLLDYASIYVSILRNIDPTPTLNIEKLKENLKQ